MEFPDDANGSEGDVVSLLETPTSRWTPEQHLYAVLLLDALERYRRYVNSPMPAMRHLVAEMDEWLETGDEVLGFKYCCHVVSLDPEAVKKEFQKARLGANQRKAKRRIR